VSHSVALKFITIFSAISVFICGTTFIIFKRRLGLSVQTNRWLAIGFAVMAILIVVGPISYRFANASTDSLSQRALQYIQYFLVGWVGTNFLVFLVLEIIQTLTRTFDPQKRIFLTEGVTRGLVAATTIGAFGGLWEAESSPRIHDVAVTLPMLPKSFSGTTIAQISDIHIGPLLHEKFLNGVVDQVMALNADMIFITGDLVDGTVDQLKAQMEPLKRLKAKEGVYFCTGNHEFYSGVEAWIEYLESIGIHVFKNSNIVLRRNVNGIEERLMIAGVHDWHGDQFSEAFATDPVKAAASPDKVPCKLLLAHNPFSIDGAAAAGFNFQFSGHTHAGQFYPFVFLVKLKLKHSEGLYRINDQTQLYVNRGTGFWGPPNRLGKRSEITHFRLQSS
jgi:predicted MPP superfamily phosphohydrolase